MRKLTWLLITLALIWFGYWLAGSILIRQGAERWFAAQSARGITAEKAGLSVLGFPNRFDLTLDSPKFADPRTGFGWEAPFVQIFTMTWKPWHLIAALPPTQTLRLPDQDIGLTSEGLRASARARPELSLPLDEAVLEGSALQATSTQGWTLALGTMVLAIRADPDRAAAYDIGLTATGLEPDRAFLAALPADSTLRPEIEAVRADLNARLSAPLDRQSGQTRPRLTGLEVKEVLVTWGTLAISAKGLIEPDAEGFAAGRVAIEVTHWQHLIPLLVAAGAVKPEVAPTVRNMLAALAQEGGSPDILNLPLTFAFGRMSLGPLPLGPAPMLLPPTN